MLELKANKDVDGGINVSLKRDGDGETLYKELIAAIATVVIDDVDARDTNAVVNYLATVSAGVAEAIASMLYTVNERQSVTISPILAHKSETVDTTPEHANECDMCDRCVLSADRIICAIARTCNYKPIPAESEEE